MTDLKKNDLKDRILIFLSLSFIVLYFFKLGFPSIWHPNEGFYAEVPREMIESGDLLTPYFNYEFRFQKPPLLYWLILPWQLLLGQSEIAVRLPSALMAAGGVFLTFWLASTVWNDKRAGLISAAIIGSAFDYNTAARYGSPEMLLTVLMTASLVVFYKWHMDNGKHKKYWLLLFYAICGLSTLAKGPIGIILPFLVIVPYFLLKKDIKELLKVFSVGGAAIYLLVSVPWYLLMVQKHGADFYNVVLGENVGRFVSKKSGTSNYLFYFGVLPWNFFPGSVFIVPAFIWLRNIVKRDSAVLYPVIWFASVFIFFSFSRSKLPTYIYPLFAPLAVITGGWISSALRDNGRQGAVLSWVSPLIPVTVIAGVIWIRSYLPGISSVYIGILIFLLSWSIWTVKEKDRFGSFAVSMFAMTVFIVIFLQSIIPQIENSARHYKEIAAKVAGEDPKKELPFYGYKIFKENLPFYLERKMRSLSLDEDKMNRFFSDNDALVMMRSDLYREKFSKSAKKVIWEGPFYHKSESRFMRYLIDIKNDRIEDFVIIR